jgi:hypothetical protein
LTHYLNIKYQKPDRKEKNEVNICKKVNFEPFFLFKDEESLVLLSDTSFGIKFDVDTG